MAGFHGVVNSRYAVDMVTIICYCSGYSEEDIIKDMDENHGISTIIARIMKEKQQDTCDSNKNHPEHR